MGWYPEPINAEAQSDRPGTRESRVLEKVRSGPESQGSREGVTRRAGVQVWVWGQGKGQESGSHILHTYHVPATTLLLYRQSCSKALNDPSYG